MHERGSIDREVWERIGASRRCTRAVRYVAANYADTVRLEGAAEAAGMERTSFSRFFHKRTGLCFSAFVRAYRVWRSLELMEQGYGTLRAIAERAGFGCLETYERAFRRIVGIPPSTYRRDHLRGGTGPGKTGSAARGGRRSMA